MFVPKYHCFVPLLEKNEGHMKFPVIFKKYCFKKDYIPSHYIHEWPFIYNLGLKCLLVNFKFINKLNILCHRKYGLQVALAGICTSFTKLFMQLGGFHVVYIPVCVFCMQNRISWYAGTFFLWWIHIVLYLDYHYEVDQY